MTVTDLRHLTLPLADTPCAWCEHTGGIAYWPPAGCIVVHHAGGDRWVCGALVDVAAEEAA